MMIDSIIIATTTTSTLEMIMIIIITATITIRSFPSLFADWSRRCVLHGHAFPYQLGL
jgi:hypothetical protein